MYPLNILTHCAIPDKQSEPPSSAQDAKEQGNFCLKILQTGPPGQATEEHKRNGKQSVKIQRTTSGEGPQKSTRQGKASVRLSKRPSCVLQENKANSAAQNKQHEGVLNEHILNEQNIRQMERDLQKDVESHQCCSSGQQSYVEGFLKVAHQRASPGTETIQNKNIAEITEQQKQRQIDPSQIRKVQMANMQLNAYNYFRRMNQQISAGQNVGEGDAAGQKAQTKDPDSAEGKESKEEDTQSIALSQTKIDFLK